VKTICYSRQADAALARLSRKTAVLIETKIDSLVLDPANFANNVKALRGSPVLRPRVGDYRVLYTEDLVILDVLTIGHRREVYDGI
jgi:mRNA interferase RelE/StbE